MTENPYSKTKPGQYMKYPAWNEGHAVGEVEGWNQAIEAVLYHLSLNMKHIKSIEALRKKVSE